ncbi:MULTISPECIES: DUF4251 domain-containing protein [Aestuariibaculum]|uniref:DUF4251 domain-containing protein n=1 Tax=Aestuariibaculum lutulentum TaxID=2920935 RepID=A0ABS9RMK3_9FLAO|nr:MULTISPECIES: DUF4251 domain-containing protein [Aestuariibaculum]MCH4554092.1 DUF4251 domain-containing protein [Aestuariibaculum lutulentum]MCR8667701.1 DUF4251 domain-containing protein [Aestuariibaculum sp. M13]
MKALTFVLSLFTLTLISCGSTQTAATPAEIEALKKLVDSKTFYIESDWAYPQITAAMSQVLNSPLMQPGSGGGGVNLIGNSNFLKLEGDSITSYLPYFGERRMGAAYGGTDNSIEFKGLVEDYRVKANKHSGYTINFDAKSNNENFTVSVDLFPNMKSSMTLTGNTRTPIQYTGKVSAKKEED